MHWRNTMALNRHPIRAITQEDIDAYERDGAVCLRQVLDPEWIESTLNSLEHLVLAGDEANLAEKVVSIITAPGGDAATVASDE